jgi:transposase InsO family protein
VDVALKVVSMAELRLEVLNEPDHTGDPVTVVCRRRKISRDRFYEYRRRLQNEGPAGLEPRSRRPHTSPNQTPAELEQRICAMRLAHPRWGPRTIRNELRRKNIASPAISTIGRILQRNDLVEPRSPRGGATKRFERSRPNDLWQIDGTQVMLADGTKVWVIDALDDHSRFLIGAIACTTLTGENAWDCLESGFATGHPHELLSDNGLCFTGRLRGHEVAFERALADAGIRHTIARPYHPQTLGKIERFHRTLKDWLKEQPAPGSVQELQSLLDRFRDHYNNERCHQSIGDIPPAARFAPATAIATPRPVEVMRHVRPNGAVVCFGCECYVGYRRAGQLVVARRVGRNLQVLYGDEVLLSVELVPSRHYYGPRR